MILEVVQSKWSLTWYDPLGPRMCVLELMNGHVLQTLREQLKVPGSRLEGSELLTRFWWIRSNRRNLIGHHRMANLLPLISLLKNAAWTSKNSISTKASNFQIFLKKNGLPTKILKLGTTLSSNQPTKAVPWSFGAPTFTKTRSF